MSSNQDKALKNELAACLRFVEALRSVQQGGGFGTIEIGIKDGRIVYVNHAIRRNVQEGT